MQSLAYRDFEIALDGDAERGYTVAVLDSPAGEARAAFVLPFDEATYAQQMTDLEDALLGLGAGSESAAAVRAFGAALFDALFAGEVRSLYDRSVQATADKQQGLRIKLRVNVTELATIPWELLYDTRQDEFVCLSRRTPLVRYVELAQPVQTLHVQPPLRVLAMVALPAEAPPLDVAREKARLTEALRPLEGEGEVELVWLEGQTWHDLQTALQGGPWHIFHFLGHAEFDPLANEGVLVGVDEAGQIDLLSGNELGRLLGDHSSLRLVVLNACEGARGSEHVPFSSAATVLVRRGLPAVLAMQYAISDKAAIEFTRSFYGALAARLPVDAAVSEARKAISLEEERSAEWATPVLYLRAPDGVLWPTAAQPVRKRWLMAAVAAASLLIAVALTVGVWWWMRPLRMPDGSYNIAIAEFQALDLDGNVVRSEWVAKMAVDATEYLTGRREALKTSFHPTIEIWGPPQRRIQPVDPEEQANRARELNADILLFGTARRVSTTRGKLQPAFFLQDKTISQAGDLWGQHRLGAELDYLEENAASQVEVNRALEARLRALARLVIGLGYYQFANEDGYRHAAEIFEEVVNDPDWGAARQNSGQELLHLFQGNAYLQLATLLRENNGDAAEIESLLAQAEDAFAAGLARNPNYARLLNSMGVLGYLRAGLQTTGNFCQWNWAELERVEQLFLAALESGSEDKVSPYDVDIAAQIGLGRVYLPRYVCNQGDTTLEMVQTRYSAALAIYESNPLPHQAYNATLAHAELGDLLFAQWQRTTPERTTPGGQPSPLLQEAETHYRAAVEMAIAADHPLALSYARRKFLPLLVLVLCYNGEAQEINVALNDLTRTFAEPQAVREEILSAVELPEECGE